MDRGEREQEVGHTSVFMHWVCGGANDYPSDLPEATHRSSRSQAQTPQPPDASQGCGDPPLRSA